MSDPSSAHRPSNGARSRGGWQGVGFRLGRLIERLLGREYLFLLLLAALIGVGGGYGAIVFRILIGWVRDAAFSSPGGLEAIRALPWTWKLAAPVAGGVLVGPLIWFGAREAKGHGVPEVMHAAANLGGRIRARVVLVKALASAISIGTGGSVGREGPIVHIGSAWGSTVAQFLGLDAERRRILLACGASAGIAGTFNAPIAGVLFSIEIILGIGSVRVFSPLVVASVLATAVCRYHLGNEPAFVLPHHDLVSLRELALYLVMGLLVGAAGAGFTRMLYLVEDLWERLPVPGWISPALGGLLIGGIALAFPEVYGVGYESIEHALRGEMVLWLMLALVAAKALATTLTLASGASGGVFAPSLFLGAMLGGAFGAVAHAVAPETTASSGAYAIIGMGAMVAGTTHAALTAILILFEMTDEYSIILPLMLACIASTVISTHISHGSIYTLKLLRRGHVLRRASRSDFLRNTQVISVLSTKVTVVPPSERLASLVERMLEAPDSPAYVVDARKRLLGVIGLRDIRGVIRDADSLGDMAVALDVLRADVPTVTLDDSLAHCMQIMTRTGDGELAVVDGDDHLIGCVRNLDITELYNREVLRFGMLGLRYFTQEGTADAAGSDSLLVPLGQQLMEVTIGGEVAGRSLREIHLRARYGVEAVGMRGEEGDAQVAPDPGTPLPRGARLLLVGSPEALERARSLFERS